VRNCFKNIEELEQFKKIFLQDCVNNHNSNTDNSQPFSPENQSHATFPVSRNQHNNTRPVENRNHEEREDQTEVDSSSPQKQREQTQRDINNLENKPNKTAEEEQELKNKQEQLRKLNNQQDNNKDGLPWDKIGLWVLAISTIILITVLITKKSKKK